LSAAEAGILRLLVQRQGTPVSRAVLGWGATCAEGRVVDTLVGRIRAKIRTLTRSEANPVVAVRGLGYRLP
jgi:DNA-binding response OmpR family regulator